MAYLKISKHNPVALRQSNSNYEAIKPLFCDLLKDFEHYVEYYQKYQNSDTINVQYSTDDITTTATMKLVSCSNSYNFTISQITPNIEYVGGKRFYKSTLDLASVVEGYYQIHFDIEIDSKTYYFTSEPIYIKSAHDNTMLLKYTHDLNQYDMLFLNSLGNNEFYLRVEGGCKQSDISPNSKDSIFIGMNYDSVQLDARPYPLYKFTFGDCLGLPFWLIEIINNAISLNEVYFDDIRYSKNEGAKLEKEQIDNDNYPLNLYTVEMLKVPMDYALDEVVLLPIVETDEATLIEFTTTRLNGELVNANGYTVLERGFVIDTVSDFSKAPITHIEGGVSVSTFYKDLIGLSAGQIYYFKAYAKTKAGTEYGAVKTFTTISYAFATVESLNNGDEYFCRIYIKDGYTALFTVDWGDGKSNTYSMVGVNNSSYYIRHFYYKGVWDIKIIASPVNYNKITQIIGDFYTMQVKQLSLYINKYYESLLDIWIIDQVKLVNVYIEPEALSNIKQIFLKNQKLNETSVNNILINADLALTNAPYSDVIINLAGEISQSSTPTGEGLTAKASLISKGVVVYTK